ncbi:MAG: lactate utilization protein [Burkholderiales bacterium]|nr:lactate utilization protein [Burkholderiales bacterium]
MRSIKRLSAHAPNFLIAETGSTLIVTNEGNCRLTTTYPRVHAQFRASKKSSQHSKTLVRLLPRSATGHSITNYVTINTGTRRDGDLDGPAHFHIILVDAGRANLFGSELQSMLRCIRCACMNNCPVYQNVGGHAYGWVYPGKLLHWLPFGAGWAKDRDMPAPTGRTFRELYRERMGSGNKKLERTTARKRAGLGLKISYRKLSLTKSEIRCHVPI